MCYVERLDQLHEQKQNDELGKCSKIAYFENLIHIVFFFCNRLCQSKQSKVYLPEAPFPHAEVSCLMLRSTDRCTPLESVKF